MQIFYYTEIVSNIFSFWIEDHFIKSITLFEALHIQANCKGELSIPIATSFHLEWYDQAAQPKWITDILELNKLTHWIDI